ncbi:Sfi1 spindle body protein-domain-containing protein [Aspergillus coremiiformis]|uniref:Sfi1 spindle body protein-domain-containing protein n=1 Tax=Aspergillus coremiiformis TaxID=138285 RepID=A0A5N6Z895_9EURO|nr:Sfi1 spindle body protein-domain-containing protein [Aspergillus coremiiformis]
MPPVPPQRRHLSYEDPSLSDEDVGLLYQVITRAERDPEVERLPYRVLFKAYDEVIAEHGVDPDPGYACLRFLLKMGSKNILGDSLFEKFENLLERMGIVIEFGEDDDGGNDTYVDSVLSTDGRLKTKVDRDTSHREDTTQPTPRRRASFNSMYDVGEDPTQRNLANRPSSRSSLSRLPIDKPEFPSARPSPRRTSTKPADSTDRTQLIAQFLDVGRRLMNKMDLLDRNGQNNELHVSDGAHARSAVYRDRSKRMARASRSRTRHSLSSESSEGDAEKSSVSTEDDEDFVEKPEVPPELLYRPSLSDLLRDASTFNMYRQRAISRRILTQWLKKAIQTRQSHQHMEVVSVNRDRGTLLRQAFEMWHSIIQTKRRAAQTERFFKHLEKRAARARDLYLVTKAFTHWAQVAAEEMARTSAARRHVLSVKYFNAWREITAVNELKAYRFALRRPFNAWRKKTGRIKASEKEVAISYDKKLMHDIYWKWFWAFCERRAPQWYDYCLKRRSLLYWLRKFRTNREHIHEIEVKNKHLALGSAWQMWSQRSKAIATGKQEAVIKQRHHLLDKTLREWSIQSHLAPAASRVSGMVDNRILQTAYVQWVKRVRMLQQAREMNRLRILRNSWTTWNDLLRCQALSARIDERLKIEAMYKWILAERFSLMRRIRDQRITREVFSRFVTNVRRTYTRLLDHAEVHEDRRNEELLKSKLTCWRDQFALQRHREFVAFEFYAPRLLQESLIAWRSKSQHVLKLEGWARNAQFYFLATLTLKKWHVATLESAKRRRQSAYAKTRRTIKMNLASNALENWRAKAHNVLDMDQQALQVSLKKSWSIASEILHEWHEQTARRVQYSHEAEIFRSRRVAYDQMIRLAEVLVQCHRLQRQADNVYRFHILGQANVCLRRLSLRIFQIRSTNETADAMRERNLRRHSRSMFRHWLEKLRMKLEAQDSPGPLVTPARNFDGPNGNIQTNRSIFDPWYQAETPFKLNDFVTDSQNPSTTPQTPNYLTSPSKRAVRARALAQVSTTPATPLYTPFARRLLRAGTTVPRSGPNPRTRNGRGSSLGTSVRFVDEEPESPTDARRSANRQF